jgi:hypothetical protein
MLRIFTELQNWTNPREMARKKNRVQQRAYDVYYSLNRQAHISIKKIQRKTRYKNKPYAIVF